MIRFIVYFSPVVAYCIGAILAHAAFGQTASDNRPPPVITIPGTTLSPMRLEPWTNWRYIIRDVTGKQVGTVEPYPNGWVVRDRNGRETGRIVR